MAARSWRHHDLHRRRHTSTGIAAAQARQPNETEPRDTSRTRVILAWSLVVQKSAALLSCKQVPQRPPCRCIGLALSLRRRHSFAPPYCRSTYTAAPPTRCKVQVGTVIVSVFVTLPHLPWSSSCRCSPGLPSLSSALAIVLRVTRVPRPGPSGRCTCPPRACRGRMPQ